MSSPDLADLFPGFASHWIDTSIGKMFARSGGAGPPLLLLHGYAQSNVMWHRVAPELARHFTLILPDLPGYGWSVAPRASADQAGMIAADASPTGWRSTSRAGSSGSPRSTSCRPGRCGTAWTATSP